MIEKIKDFYKKSRPLKHKNLFIADEKAIRTFRARTRFTLNFFAILFPIIILSIGFLYFLAPNGQPLYKYSSPSMVTLSIAIFCMVLGYAISYYLMNRIFHPLEKLNEAIKEIASGNYDITLDYDGSIEEIQNTIDNFNFMTRELNSVEIMRKDFIANVSHEFKTPLSSINGYVTLLQDLDLSPKEREEYTKLALLNVNKLNDLSSNILHLSKLENQTGRSKPDTYRLDEQLREAIVLLEPVWSQKNILFDIDMEEITYTGQKSLLLHVWNNLISNAIKFSNENSEIVIRLYQYNGDTIVTVRDYGIGMDEETIRHIFEKFYQGDSSRIAQGNGLGLALCKEIMVKCGGKIKVESTPGKGSCFYVTLP